jgi:hypothetical protein
MKKHLLLPLLLTSLLHLAGCTSKKDIPTPPVTPGTLVGYWYLESEESVITPQGGPHLTSSKLYPPGIYLIRYTATTFQSYASGPQAKTYTYSLSGTTYTYTDGSKRPHTVEITELTNRRLVTKDSYMDGTTAVLLTSTLTP